MRVASKNKAKINKSHPKEKALQTSRKNELSVVEDTDTVMEAENNGSAAEAEANGNIELAIKLYEQNIKRGLADATPYNRLMILYRKEKRYKDELRVIDKGIEVFNKQIERGQAKLLKNSKSKTKIKQLSESFGKKVGLKEYVPVEVERWMKRKEVVKKKLKK